MFIQEKCTEGRCLWWVVGEEGCWWWWEDPILCFILYYFIYIFYIHELVCFCSYSDETLNNAKQKEKVEMDSFHTCTDAPSDGNDFSLSKNLHSNIINNLNNLDLVDSFQKETPILNSIVEKPDAAQSECTSKTRDAQSRDARRPIAEAEVRRSESAEKLLPLRPDGSSKQDNTDRLTTDSGIDLISSPPYPQTENIYDSVRHFNSRRWKPPEKQETRRKREEDVEFLHKIGNDLIMEMGESIAPDDIALIINLLLLLLLLLFDKFKVA